MRAIHEVGKDVTAQQMLGHRDLLLHRVREGAHVRAALRPVRGGQQRAGLPGPRRSRGPLPGDRGRSDAETLGFKIASREKQLHAIRTYFAFW